MGCDIHLHAEIKVNGKWEHYAHPHIRRDYRLFAKMASVRNAPYGHPEHIAGAAAYLRTKARNGRAEVLASPGVCRALKRRSGNKQDVFYPCRPGQTHSVDKFTIDVFECRHMPLLPPCSSSLTPFVLRNERLVRFRVTPCGTGAGRSAGCRS